MPTNKPYHVSFPARIAGFTAAILGFALSGAAQVESDRTASPEKQDVVTLDRLTVTGSCLTTPANATPLTIVTQDTIERGGVATNLLEVLRKQIPALSGSGNLGLSNASINAPSTYGGARLSLHNTTTLVLLNGHRLATNGANARNGLNFVDVSQFPLSAIERVEVLTDGASAVYGSDAVGGVINVILKPAFNGSEVGGRYAFSTNTGNYSERSAHFVTGVKKDWLGVIVTGEYSKSTPLYQDQRDFSNDARSASVSGVVGTSYLNPAYNSPREAVIVGPTATATSIANTGAYVSGSTSLNLAPSVTLYGSREQLSSYIGLTAKLIDKKLEAFANALLVRSNSFSQLAAQNVSFTSTGVPGVIVDDAPYNPVNGTVSGVVFRYLPAPRKYLARSHETSLTAGLKGELSPGWNWETSYTSSRSRLVARLQNVLFAPNLDLAARGGYDANGNAVTGGTYSRVYKDFTAPDLPAGTTGAAAVAYYAAQRTSDNTVLQPALDPFARPAAVDPASLANVLGTARADLRSELNTYDFVLRGHLAELPAGDLLVALGGNYRDEKLIGLPDQNSRNTGPTAQRWAGASYFDPVDQSRYVRAGFTEFQIPVMSPKWNAPLVRSLDLSVAFRIEDYNEAGVSHVPKYGVRWQPFDEQLTIRYTYSKGFSAPTLYAMYGPATQGASGNLSAVLGYNDTTSRAATQRLSSNPNLKAATSRSHSIGFVALPKMLPGLRLSVDYLDMTISGLAGSMGGTNIAQSVNQYGTISPWADLVTIDGAPITGPGQLRAFFDTNGAAAGNRIFINDIRRNYAGAILRSVDTSIDYVLPVMPIGQFEVGTTGTFFIDDKIQAIPTEPYYEYAGLVTTTPPGEGTIPGYRFYSHATWSKGPWKINLGHTYIPSVDDIGSGGSTFATSTTLKRARVGSFTSWDVALGYDLKLNRRSFYVPTDVALRVGVNNVSNHMPPPAPQAYSTTSAAGADVATYGAIGRLYFVSAELKF